MGYTGILGCIETCWGILTNVGLWGILGYIVVYWAYVQTPEGKHTVNTKDPMFEEARILQESSYSDDRAKAMPYDMIWHGTFHGNDTALEASIASGQMSVAMVDGQRFLAWRQVAAGTSKDMKHEQKITSGQLSGYVWGTLGYIGAYWGALGCISFYCGILVYVGLWWGM